MESRQIILNTIYNPTLIGQAQPKSRPYYWIAIESENGKSVTVLEVNNGKDNVEIVGWHKLDRKGLNKLRKQAEREDGQLLILTSDKEAAAALSALPSDVSAFKDTDSSANTQEKIGESGLVSDEERVQYYREEFDPSRKAGFSGASVERLKKARAFGFNPSSI